MNSGAMRKKRNLFMSENVGLEEEETGIPEEHIETQSNMSNQISRGLGGFAQRLNYKS